MDTKLLRLFINIPLCLEQARLYTGRMHLLSGEARESLPKAYFAALEREIRAVSEDVSEYSISSVYLGNGPANLVPSSQWTSLFRRIRENFRVNNAEFLLKLDPVLVGNDDLLRVAGLRRCVITMDMVSDIPEELEAAGLKRGSGEMTRACLRLAENHIRHFDLLLYYGIPGQTVESLSRSLQRAISMGGGHISLLPCPMSPLPRELIGMQQAKGAEILRQAGFKPYRPGRYARDGQAIRYYMDDSLEFMGVGSGAVSRFDDLHFMNTEDLDLYMKNADDCTVICKNL